MARTKQLKRAFRFGAINLPDIPGLTPEKVRDQYAATYPQLTTAAIKGPEYKDGKQLYTFRENLGTKG